ncbi:hypothetical protein APSETT444_004929 [Aspergillus pseudonomiae]
MAVLSSTKNEALRLKSVPSSQKYEWARLTGSNEPITYSMNLCLINLVYAIWLVLKRREEYFSPAGQKKAVIIDSRNAISSSSQEKLDEDEDGLFSEQRIGEHHRMAIRKFGKLWEQVSLSKTRRNVNICKLKNGGREPNRSLERGVPECSSHAHNSLREEKTIKAFEDWLAEEAITADSLPKLGVYGQDFLSVLITMGTKREYTIPLFRWVMNTYPSMYMRAENRSQKQSLLAEAHSRPNSKAFVPYFLRNYPAQTAKILELDNSVLLDILPVMIEEDCSEPIFAKLNSVVLATTDSQKNSILHLLCEYEVEEWESTQDADHWTEKRVRLIKNFLTYYPYSIQLRNWSNQSAYQHRIRTFAACKEVVPKEKIDPSLGFGLEPRESRDDKILTLLKERIMDLNDNELIAALLYGQIQRRVFYLDLTELGHMDNPKPASTVKDLEQQLVRKGNVEDIFNVLWEKGVKKIIKISVDDDEDLPHSDEVIETLGKFGIEEWDWRRKDLCSSVILKAAQNSRKVFLCSTGNKAVLRSWSAPDGLNYLKKVTRQVS